MIEIFEGRIGGGKTYTAVERIALAVAGGQTVYTNIEIIPEGFARLVALKYGVEVEPDQVNMLPEDIFGWENEIRWGSLGCPTLVVLDEIHLWFNSRDWQRTQDKHRGMLRFLSQSRKANVDVIFITQVISNIDKQFRQYAQYYWSLRDMARLDAFLIKTLFSNCIFYVQKDYDGLVLRKGLKFKDKRIFKAYRTEAFLSPEMEELARIERARAHKKRKMKRTNIFKRFWLMIRYELLSFK